METVFFYKDMYTRSFRSDWLLLIYAGANASEREGRETVTMLEMGDQHAPRVRGSRTCLIAAGATRYGADD